MIEDDVLVEGLELPALGVGLQVGVTLGTGEDELVRERRGRHGERTRVLLARGRLDLGLQLHLEVDFREVRRTVCDSAVSFGVDVVVPAVQQRHQRDHGQRSKDGQHHDQRGPAGQQVLSFFRLFHGFKNSRFSAI